MIAADAAEWIRTVVLPETYRRNSSDPARCACQGGVCLHCQEGRHAKCQVVAWGGAPLARCETFICDRRGMVAGASGVINEVWRSGKPCRWVCACGCAPVGAALPPGGLAELPSTYQLDLFASF
ncbi:DUF6248 family natural product biosynthesis protein [Micromonospora aurantiaca (nom. illeg.)]|uniref:DUF6248 family natural product biosynthesis protein n=1 Tax=Micromonospora aurantiaca (nom. illeg.) TaxID=47850 RepID=UPI001656D111|nr:DUF6248 family natural product biosynthesis protein [Micromonospora aurantiaca]MBC9000467.1 hypothetical protein [Micromonospora aurantiaca]